MSGPAEKSQESKITLLIVTLDYQMRHAKRQSRYRCLYDPRTQVIEIKERMLEKINKELERPIKFGLADLFVVLILTEIANDSVELPSGITSKEKVTLVYLEDFRQLSSYLNNKKVDRKKSYIRMVVRDTPLFK